MYSFLRSRILPVVFLSSLPAWAQPALVAHTVAGSSNGTSVTTSAINTTVSSMTETGNYYLVTNSGVVQPSATFRNATAIVTGCPFSPNTYIQATIVTIGSNSTIRLCLNLNSSGNGYCAAFDYWGDIFKYTGGSGTGLSVGGSCSITAGSVIKLSLSGTTYTTSVNGSNCATATDSTYTSGSPGIFLASDSANAPQLSTFTAE